MNPNTSSIPLIDRQSIDSVYSGKAGRCGCGCAGRHSSKPASITRMLNRLSLATEAKFRTGAGFLAWEEGERVYVIYFKSTPALQGSSK